MNKIHEISISNKMRSSIYSLGWEVNTMKKRPTFLVKRNLLVETIYMSLSNLSSKQVWK